MNDLERTRSDCWRPSRHRRTRRPRTPARADHGILGSNSVRRPAPQGSPGSVLAQVCRCRARSCQEVAPRGTSFLGRGGKRPEEQGCSLRAPAPCGVRPRRPAALTAQAAPTWQVPPRLPSGVQACREHPPRGKQTQPRARRPAPKGEGSARARPCALHPAPLSTCCDLIRLPQ